MPLGEKPMLFEDEWPPLPAAFSLGASTITACVVSMIPAMEQAFCSPLRVTFAGSSTPCTQVCVKENVRHTICSPPTSQFCYAPNP